ncbi:hypothetical protein ACU4GA_25405 [Methylobacterium oryzae CBMB20]
MRVEGGHDNRIAIEEGAVVSAASGRAIVGAFTTGTITNRGTLIGDVDLTGGGQTGRVLFDNGFDGAASAILRTGPDGVIALGDGGRLRNGAILDIGGVGKVARATVTGNFEQTESGRLLVDIAPLATDPALRNDLLTVTGTASLEGVVEPHLIDGLSPGRYTFLRAGQVENVGASATGSSISSGAVPISWTIVSTGNSIALVPQAHFTAPVGVTLTEDQRSVAARPAGCLGWKHDQAGHALRALPLRRQLEGLRRRPGRVEARVQPGQPDRPDARYPQGPPARHELSGIHRYRHAPA